MVHLVAFQLVHGLFGVFTICIGDEGKAFRAVGGLVTRQEETLDAADWAE